MKIEISTILLVLLTSIYGCSNQQIYEGIQQNRQQECKVLPEPQYEECMKEYEESYDSYKKALDEAADQ